MQREIDLSHDVLLAGQGGALDVLAMISKLIPSEDWCLIGGMMTYLVLEEHGSGAGTRSSQTKDADVLVEVATGSARSVVTKLLSMGFTQMEPFFGQMDAQARYWMGATLIDVLAPDDTEDADLEVVEATRTIGAPGGRRALQVSSRATVYYRDDGLVDLRLPAIEHAVVIKAAAMEDPRTEAQPRHLDDVVALLRAMPDPRQLSEQLSAADVDLLRRIRARVNDVGDAEATAALLLLAGAS